MLRQRLSSNFRFAVRPLVWLSAGAIATSTTPLYAQSVDGADSDTSFASGSESEGDPSATSWLAAPSVALTGWGAAAAGPAVAPAPAAPNRTAPATPAASTPAPAAPAKDDGAELRTVGYIAGGVGLVGFILFAVAGIAAKNAHDRLDEACTADRCNSASRDADIADGKLFQTAANIGLATGLAGLGLGATLVVLGSHSTSDAPTVGSAAPGGVLTFAGRF